MNLQGSFYDIFLVFFSPIIRSSVTPKNKKSKKNDFKVFTCCHSCDWLAINFPTHKIPTFKSIYKFTLQSFAEVQNWAKIEIFFIFNASAV